MATQQSVLLHLSPLMFSAIGTSPKFQITAIHSRRPRHSTATWMERITIASIFYFLLSSRFLPPLFFCLFFKSRAPSSKPYQHRPCPYRRHTPPFANLIHMAGFAHHKTWTDLMPNLNFITTNRQCRSSGSEPSSQSPSRRFGLFLHAQTRTFCLSSPQLVSWGPNAMVPTGQLWPPFWPIRWFVRLLMLPGIRRDKTRQGQGPNDFDGVVVTCGSIVVWLSVWSFLRTPPLLPFESTPYHGTSLLFRGTYGYTVPYKSWLCRGSPACQQFVGFDPRTPALRPVTCNSHPI